ncbi:MAG: hypothetical protein IKB42_02825 [Clostridia bacterium]|nr:hypothetical protein [Clostridia bacterium]
MKKLVKYVSSIMICLFASLLLVACGEPTIVSAHIKEGTIVTTVDRGSAKTDLNLNNAKAVIKFSDGSQIEVDASKLSFGDIDLSTIGNDKQLKVKYGDFEFAVEIDVVKPHVTSAYIKAGTVNTSVVVGSALNLTNAVAVVNYSNGEQKEVAAADLGFNMATLDLTTVGEDKPLKITYDGYQFEIKIDVVADPEDAVVEVASAVITKGSIVDTVIEGATIAELGLDNATALITYDDGTSETVELDAADFNTANLDLTTVGTKTIAVTYEYNNNLRDTEFVFYVQIVVNPVPEEQKIILTGFSSDLEDEFVRNSAVKANKETEFMDRTKTHKVGDDNAFDFRINALGVVDGNIVEGIKGVKTEVKVQKVENSTPVDLTPQEMTEYVEATTYTSVDFSQEAVGKKFKVTVSATNFDPDYFEGTPSFDLTFDVVDGYNVYEAKELSLFDNANIDGAWTELKEEWGFTNVTTKALVLQNSIHVTDDVIPDKFFYTQAEVDADPELMSKTNLEPVGSLKDGAGDDDMLYFRYLKDGETFDIHGNYFDISVADKVNNKNEVEVKGLSRSVVSDTDGNGIWIDSVNGHSYLTTHTALFKVQGGKMEGGQLINCNDGAVHTSSTGKLTVQDTYFIGNGRRSVDPLASGGIILLKSESVNLDVVNTINKDWFIGWMTEYGYDQTGIQPFPTDMTAPDFAQKFAAWTNIINNGTERNSHTNILKSKGYNNYSSLMYFWGTPNIVIGDCEFIGAGGPVIVTDHQTGDYEAFSTPDHPMGASSENYFHYLMGSGGHAPEIDIYNSKMESYVNGLEAWFATYPGATAQFAQIVTANQAFTAAGVSSFLKNYEGIPNATNLVVLHKWGAKEFKEVAVFTRGTVRKFDTKAQYEAYYDADDTNNPTYFGYDRSIVMTGDMDQPFNYDPANGAYTQKVKLVESQMNSTAPEMVRFENSTNGYSVGLGDGYPNRVDLSDAGSGAVFAKAATGSTYLNVYMANGFGAMMELFPYTPAA